MLLGLTGGYCAGKNEVAAILEKLGWSCIDVDTLGHEAVELSREAIVARFGVGILDAEGRVDRKAVARIVFADPKALADQEAIIHPAAIRLLGERIAALEHEAALAGRESLVCVNAALLYRAPQAALCDAVVEVRSGLFARLRRARARDGLGARQAFLRIARQRAFWGLRGKAGRPVVFLRNSGSREKLRRAATRAVERARAAAASRPLRRAKSLDNPR